MTSGVLEELVYDTLYFRRSSPEASCLQANIAGEELRKESAEALPIIERVVKTIVSPDFNESKDQTFAGLADLLGAYMVIGSAYDAHRCVRFLRDLPPTLQAKALALVPVFFRRGRIRPIEKAANDQKIAPNEQLLNFVRDSSRSTDQAIKESAMWAMSYFDSCPA